MDNLADAHAANAADSAKPKPEGLNEFSPRAIVCGLLVAGLMGASYPYVVLKLGFGPNVSVVAAILGYVALGLVFTKLAALVGFATTPYNRWENNIVQTAGTAAAQTAFMCVLLAAFDMLAQSKLVDFQVVLTPMQSFAWLTTAGLLGVFLAVPLRRHYIVDEKLPFADGLAAGETLLVCDSAGPTAARAALFMVAGIVASGVVMMLNEDSHVFGLFSSTFVFGTAVMTSTRFGIEWSLLAVGSGMIIGPRINISMLLGTILSWAIAPEVLLHFGVIKEAFKRNDVLFWVMWPATGMMVAGGLTALLLRWRVLARTFKRLSAAADGDEFPLRWVVVGAMVSGTALVAVQKVLLDLPVWMTLTAIVLSAPLALVGLRVLGETNWGPVSALSNMMQGVFAIVAPGHVPGNMVASGITGTIAISSEGLMQDFKAGDMIGSSPRYLTYMQLLATPIGAAAVALIYPMLRDQYGIGGDTGLSSPISRKWAGFAEILSRGLNALPEGALTALIIGVLLGIGLAILELQVKDKTWVPSPTAVGIGMLVPASVIVTMVMGGLTGYAWERASPQTSKLYLTPLASGLIAGEALIAVIVPLLIVLGLIGH
jgi:uncharacterized oligopeptide transporter (OPT) family protein